MNQEFRKGKPSVCLPPLAVIGLAALVMIDPTDVASAQSRDQRGQARGGQSSPAPQRNYSPQQGDVHARREAVRTREPVSIPQRPAFVPQRPAPQPQRPDVTPQRTDRTPQSPGQRTDRQPIIPSQRTDRRPTTSDQQTDRTPFNSRQRTDRFPSTTGQQTDRVRREGFEPRSGARQPVHNAASILAHRTFTRTQEGRRYDNGILLRKGTPVQEAWQRRYFPRGSYHYPYYVPSYTAASVVISPFGFFFGVCAPYISRAHCDYVPSTVVYVDIPVYSGNDCRGYPPLDRADNLLDRDYLASREPGLLNAVDELREAFGRGDIDSLVTLVDPNIKIAVYERGKYSYSLNSMDYLDMTRDALRTMDTITLNITRIHQRGAGVYVVSGEHVYTAHDGSGRTVYVSYVLENIRGMWTLTQVGTAPDRIQSF